MGCIRNRRVKHRTIRRTERSHNVLRQIPETTVLNGKFWG